MPVTLQTPEVILQGTHWRVVDIRQHCLNGGKWEAHITYGLFDENNNLVKTVQATPITGADWNEWWADYTSGTKLDQDMLNELGIEAELPVDNENYYLNPVE